MGKWVSCEVIRDISFKSSNLTAFTSQLDYFWYNFKLKNQSA